VEEEAQLSSAALWDKAALQWAARVRGGEVNREVILNQAHLALLGEVNGLTVLDLGCGEGHFARRPRLVKWGEWWPEADFATLDFRRPISNYAAALRDAGFLIRDLLEPTPPPEAIEQDPEAWADTLRIAHFLILDCVKP
jgi:hypothetical protein